MEIEIKARLRDREAVMAKLTALGCIFSEPKTQDDMVWVAKTGSLEEFLSNPVFLRIRIQNDGAIVLTAKKSKAFTGDSSLVKREHEVVVDSADEARNILEMLGLKEAVRVVKKRQKTNHSGYEICIDDIEGLGCFLELEKIGEESEAVRIQEEMIVFLESLGISAADKISKGYDILMLENQAVQ
jgi:adenylate cyclase class 2